MSRSAARSPRAPRTPLMAGPGSMIAAVAAQARRAVGRTRDPAPSGGAAFFANAFGPKGFFLALPRHKQVRAFGR